MQCVLPGRSICHNGDVSLWLWEQASNHPKQSMINGGWGESGVEQRDETRGRTERRHRERERRIDSRLDNRLGHCCAVLSWSTLGEMLWVSVKLSFSLKTFISANLINGWWIKTLHNVPSSNVSGCAVTFFWIRTWAQNSFSSSQSFNFRSSLRGNGCFWIATVARSNLP